MKIVWCKIFWHRWITKKLYYMNYGKPYKECVFCGKTKRFDAKLYG